uniref:Uncharacterized protein n=1 Tax=mine drainage metagenome TaxID=410659 RepID=E6PG31_9ZZZZ
MPAQAPRDRGRMNRFACVRPFLPSVIKSGQMASRSIDTEGIEQLELWVEELESAEAQRSCELTEQAARPGESGQKWSTVGR